MSDRTFTEEELSVDHFRRGQFVRFMGGPTMCVLTSPDEDDDVYCAWWGPTGDLNFADLPASTLIHVDPTTEWNPWPAPQPPVSKRRLVLRWCSLRLASLLGPGKNLGKPRLLQERDLPSRDFV